MAGSEALPNVVIKILALLTFMTYSFYYAVIIMRLSIRHYSEVLGCQGIAFYNSNIGQVTPGVNREEEM